MGYLGGLVSLKSCSMLKLRVRGGLNEEEAGYLRTCLFG